MQRLGAFLARLQRQWALGFSILLVLSLYAVAFGVVALLVVSGLLLIVAPGSDESVWLAASAVVWLPLAVGAAKSFLRDAAKKDAEEAV